ncbi:MAG: hypothetical protein JJU02_03145 [Cryomorphaceae bacterium]|nr:hypothetical protein [Cryomorphaceae bacterium]
MKNTESGISCNIELYKLLTEKSAAKLAVFEKLKVIFQDWKLVLETLAKELSTDVCGANDNIEIEYHDISTFEAKVRLAGDILFSYMHTNVFALDDSHYIHGHSHIKKNPNDGFFGTLNMYYFLGDSIKYNRMNDNGILIARIMVNQKGCFFVEGIKPFGDMERFDPKRPLQDKWLKKIAETAIKIMLEIDLTLPPKQHAQLMSVADIQSVRQELRFSTQQRLGFRK